jgi:hypothetical protein
MYIYRITIEVNNKEFYYKLYDEEYDYDGDEDFSLDEIESYKDFKKDSTIDELLTSIKEIIK